LRRRTIFDDRQRSVRAKDRPSLLGTLGTGVWLMEGGTRGVFSEGELRGDWGPVALSRSKLTLGGDLKRQRINRGVRGAERASPPPAENEKEKF